ncbi:WD40 repeat-like protein [Anaeromyces robustus]|uniref:WD40 repeat-like protein n=1 Tax=Anaeromyces robustus TaxID=1754192 RepID=A0A1Y1WSP8_9FUNG|nr:WD40 repeat-like protein [Anaeromyces robustus]|eukprot:ORX76164.1 WD40 repeat-like protein [Anaeromyces robustus]
MICNNIKNTTNNLSSWRKSLTYTNKIDPEYYIDSYKIYLEEAEEKWPTSITTNGDYIAYTSAVKKNNFIIYKDNKDSKFNELNKEENDDYENSETNNENDGSDISSKENKNDNIVNYKLVHKNSYNYPIYDVAWEKNFIALGSENGKVNLVKIPQNLLENSEGTITPEEELMCEMQSSNTKVMPSLPNQFVFSQRIHSVDLNPTSVSENSSPTHFIATEKNLIHMWNIERQFYVNQEQTELDTIFNAKFCPHLSSSYLIAAAGSNGKLHIYDSTKFSKNSIIWKCSSMKKNIEITDIAWNPFVPYWIAIARSDAIVNIWDLRYTKGHVGQIDGHYHSIKSIAWSNTHSEILATGSLDRSFNTWNFKKGTYYTLENKKNINNLYDEYNYNISTSENMLNLDYYKQLKMLNAKLITTYTEDYGGGIINVISSKSKPDVFYTLTNNNEIFSHTLKNDLFERMISYKYDSLQSIERKVELNNYTRNIGNAYKNIISLSRLQKEENVLADLINICTPYPEIKPEDWEFPPLQKSEENIANYCKQEYIKQFKEDLEKYTSKLPPGYASKEEKWLGGITEKLKEDIKIVQLRINVLSSIKSDKWEFIIENKDKLLEVLKKDTLFMEPDEIKQMIACLIPHDHLTALKMGLELNKMFDSQEERDYSDLTAINHLLLFPTVYDTDENMVTLLPELETSLSVNTIDTNNLVDPSTHVYSKNCLLTKFINDENSINKIPMHAYHSLTSLLQDSLLIIPLLELEIKIDEVLYNKDLSKEDIDKNIIDIVKNSYIIKEVPKDEEINKSISRNYTASHQKSSLSVTTNRLYLDALLRNSLFEEFFYTSMDLFMQYFQLDFSRTIISTIDRIALSKVKESIDQIYQKIASDITDVINDIQQIQSFDKNSFDELFKKLNNNILTLADLIALLNKIGVACANGIQIIPLLDDKGGIFFSFTQSFLIELIEQLSSSLYSFIATVKLISEKTNYGFSTDDLKEQIIERIVINDGEIRKKPLYDYYKIKSFNESFDLTVNTIDCIINDLNNFDNLNVDLSNL